MLVGQHTTHFAIDVDAGDLAETQRHHEVIDGVDAQLIGQRVVIHIAGFNDALVHVYRPQRQPVAAELMPAESPGAGVIDNGAGRSLTGLQRGHGHERFVGRTRRVGATQRPVEQGLVNRVVQRLPTFVVNAVDKQIRVKGRLADKGQHFPRARIYGHQRAAPVPEHVFHQLL